MSDRSLQAAIVAYLRKSAASLPAHAEGLEVACGCVMEAFGLSEAEVSAPSNLLQAYAAGAGAGPAAAAAGAAASGSDAGSLECECRRRVCKARAPKSSGLCHVCKGGGGPLLLGPTWHTTPPPAVQAR